MAVAGWRIGKGQGLSDLEYAMMVSTGAVSNDTIVMTLVHDCQVLDLPNDLFGPHDVPVDYIVTPTRVVTCADRVSPKPAGIIWSLLRLSDLDRVPVLRRIRYREWNAGKNVRLSGEDADPGGLEDVILPEPHGDCRKPRPLGNKDQNVQKPREEKRKAGSQQEVNGGNIVEEARETSRRVTGREKMMMRYGEFVSHLTVLW